MQIIVICADRTEYVRKEVDIGIVFFYNPCYDMRLSLGCLFDVFVKIKRRQGAKVYSYRFPYAVDGSAARYFYGSAAVVAFRGD